MHQEDKRHLTYDYIIVGTGTAGALMAKKLTDDKKTSVLALEAGDNNSNERPIRDSLFAPPAILTDQFLPLYFWQGMGIPQKHVNDRTFNWTGGRTLGGASSVNNEQYVRPTPANMKQWEHHLGPLWSPEQETYQLTQLEKYNGQTHNPHARSFTGRLDIRQTPVNPTHMTEKLVTAMERATGFPRILDYNDPNTPMGPFTRWQLYQMPNGVRESSDTAFLTSDVIDRNGQGVNGRRLKVSLKSTVLRVLFDHNRCAIGIEYLKEGEYVQAYASKKVIVSAGINSPKLLMTSGIGSEDVLKEADIPVVYHNPNVGKHLTTHAITTSAFTTNPNDQALPTDDPRALYTGGAFLPDPTPGADPNRRGVQMIGQKDSNGGLNLLFFLSEPKSKGSIRVQNNDPLKMVLADEGFLNNSADMASLKNIYRTYIKHIATELKKIDAKYQLKSPTSDVLEDDSKLENHIKNNISPAHHIQGMLRMAPSPEHGVVDALGQVYGVNDLIVADDTIAPFVSDGNTSAPAYFIGANIADQLLRWQKGNWW